MRAAVYFNYKAQFFAEEINNVSAYGLLSYESVALDLPFLMSLPEKYFRKRSFLSKCCSLSFQIMIISRIIRQSNHQCNCRTCTLPTASGSPRSSGDLRSRALRAVIRHHSNVLRDERVQAVPGSDASRPDSWFLGREAELAFTIV